MKLDVVSLDGNKAGSIDLEDEIFGLEPRADLIQRMVRYQLSKRQAGTHKVKNRDEIARTGAKLGKQKGGGRARHGSARVVQFRGGGRAFGPLVRSHAHDLPKKVRALALRHALSSKAKASEIVVLDNAELSEPKTKTLSGILAKLGLNSVLVIDGAAANSNMLLASRNLPNIDVLPVQGINVYDILRRDKLVLTRAAVDALKERFK
ncbi:MAG: 50S ribosomal protein L4 [Rhodobiaceae bacterium]|nr:50S ribosomal protein L4 [Rhodobiaceae bacterium]MCC0017159.1 50S ribosomal protein L4 [Rhodobiaceae bacterium]MCC0052438.1 50S ribosomal protein L4 [Rhodobiaceae bacterium]